MVWVRLCGKVVQWLSGDKQEGGGNNTVKVHLQHLQEYQGAYSDVEATMKSKDFKLTEYVKVSAGEVSEGYVNLGLTASTSKVVVKEHDTII